MQIDSHKDVSKRYQVGKLNGASRSAAAGWLSGRQAVQWVWALRDVNLSVNRRRGRGNHRPQRCWQEHAASITRAGLETDDWAD